MSRAYKSSLHVRRANGRDKESIIHLKGFLSLGLIIAVLFIFVAVRTSRALNANYNRPHPLMDYVPQEIGIYDTLYGELTESDCRGCHGNSLAERHHATPLVVKDHQCNACHGVLPDGGVSIIRNCTTSGCHGQNDLDTNGWHHNTDMSDSGSCVACHNPNLISEITPVRDLDLYPPSVVTPTPFSCENCHWEQGCSPAQGADPTHPGHPSTFNHYNDLGESIGFYEYSKSIYGNFDTHHMGFKGNIVPFECYQCHAQNPQSPSWDPFDPQIIRSCEICHSIDTLHKIGPHVHNTNGWMATGFHTATGQDDPSDVDPTVYTTFTADQQCFGCHGDAVPEYTPSVSPMKPALDTSVGGTQPNHGGCGALVALRGTAFGDEHEKDSKVEIEDCKGEWINLPVHGWSDTLIEVEIPCWTTLLPQGNYRIKVVTSAGESNARVFTMDNCTFSLALAPDSGSCGTWVKISVTNPHAGGLGSARSQIFDDGYHGVCRVVDFASSQGTYTALDYQNWNDLSFEVRFYDFFKDKVSPDTGERNYIQDIGTEPSILKGTGLAAGQWSVFVKSIYFGDEDQNGTLSTGDTIFQVMSSAPLSFELNKEAVIYSVTPARIRNDSLLKILGINFGTSQGSGEIRLGSQDDAMSTVLGKGVLQDNVQSWSNTAIKVKASTLCDWSGKIKYLWLEKNGVKTNCQKINIL
jgi:hypothetical protein